MFGGRAYLKKAEIIKNNLLKAETDRVEGEDQENSILSLCQRRIEAQEIYKI